MSSWKMGRDNAKKKKKRKKISMHRQKETSPCPYDLEFVLMRPEVSSEARTRDESPHPPAYIKSCKHFANASAERDFSPSR